MTGYLSMVFRLFTDSLCSVDYRRNRFVTVSIYLLYTLTII